MIGRCCEYMHSHLVDLIGSRQVLVTGIEKEYCMCHTFMDYVRMLRMEV